MCAMPVASVSSIQELNLGPEPPTEAPEGLAVDDKPSGAVVGGSLIAFAPEVSGLHQRDVLQSLLLAQLAANSKAERHTDPLAWFRAYTSVLEQAGWVVASSSGIRRYLPQVSRFFVSTVVSDVFRRILVPEQLAFVTATMSAFRSDLAGASQLVFECPSHSGGMGNFQVVLATEEDGVLSLSIVQVSFKVPRHVPRLFLEEFTNAAEFRVAILDLTQNEQVYERVRGTIARKVETRLPRYVAPLSLI